MIKANSNPQDRHRGRASTLHGSPGDEACGKQKSCERAVGMRSGRGEQSRNAVVMRERPAAVLQCIEGVCGRGCE